MADRNTKKVVESLGEKGTKVSSTPPVVDPPVEKDPPDKKPSTYYLAKTLQEYQARQKAYADSLDLYNRQQAYNAEYFSNFGRVELPSSSGDTDILKLLAGAVNEAYSNPSAFVPRLPSVESRGRLVRHIYPEEDPTKNALLAGSKTPNSVSNTRDILDSVISDDSVDFSQGLDENMSDSNYMISDPYIDYPEREGGFFDDYDSRKYYGHSFPYKTAVSTARGITNDPTYVSFRHPISQAHRLGDYVDPNSNVYDANNIVDVEIPFYKKPTQKVLPPEGYEMNKTITSKPEPRPPLRKPISIEPRSMVQESQNREIPLKKMPVRYTPTQYPNVRVAHYPDGTKAYINREGQTAEYTYGQVPRFNKSFQYNKQDGKEE